MSAPVGIRRRPDISGLILVVGAVTYALLCVPAIERRGYPPIDPAWLAVTYVWIVPIWLSALYDSWAFRSRRWHLVAFALATAFVDSGTYGGITPRYVDPFLMLADTILLCGPAHLVVGFAAEALVQVVLGRCRRLHEQGGDKEVGGPSRLPLRAWLVGGSSVCLAVAFVVVYRTSVIREDRERGISFADDEWRRGQAVVYRGEDKYRDDLVIRDGVSVTYAVDRETGMAVRYRAPDNGFHDAYNSRIAELIELHGLPSWSLRDNIPSVERLIGLLDAPGFTEVSSFPHRLTTKITITNPNGSVCVDTPHISQMGFGFGEKPVCVNRQAELAIIRVGSRSVEVFHQDGRWIASVQR